ncbi:MAG: LUD domain-containing protein, partial [Thermoleophilia bacterium]|nr:LUD domain-containing protein [Thermoleophilia bacterium]
VRPHQVAREIAQLVTAGSAEKGPRVGSEANNSALVAVDPVLSGLVEELVLLGVSAVTASVEAVRTLPHVFAGVTGALCAVAETGTVVVGPGRATEGLLAVLPQLHVVVLPAERIKPDLASALAELAPLAAQPGTRLAFITGPSRTADIELTTVLGVHGPLDLAVIVVVPERIG